ncbi:MAG TPA: DUF4397 domain-containing protein [Chitinophagaceae bacterium]|nr:DUF4397 domain-containing protein [Chitinophagaceae bacterium]
MRTNKFIKHIGLVAIVAGFTWGCVKYKGKEVALENTTFTDQSFVQVHNGILNATRNYIYVDAAPVTGAALSYNSTFPSTPSNFSVTEGYRMFLVKDTLSTTTQAQLSFAENLQAGNYYTIFLYDTLNSPKKKIVTNDILIPTDTSARVRFANFIFSRTAVPNVDIFSLKRNANVFTNVGVTDVTGYVPYASALNDTLYVRETGTSNLLATMNGFNPVQKRSYTLVFRGRYQTTGTTGIARLLTSFSSN